MNLICRTQAYLKSVSATVNALSGMICSDELKGNAETQYKIAIAMIELEQATADFIVGTELDSVASQSVAISKRRFISSNERVIRHAGAEERLRKSLLYRCNTHGISNRKGNIQRMALL